MELPTQSRNVPLMKKRNKKIAFSAAILCISLLVVDVHGQGGENFDGPFIVLTLMTMTGGNAGSPILKFGPANRADCVAKLQPHTDKYCR